MKQTDPNIDLLLSVAQKLKPLLREVVFLGGCATGLLVTDPGAAAVRTTYDVDVIAEIMSYADYVIFSQRLRKLGFKEDSSENAPICRWTSGKAILDVMPLDEKILGFSNRWYADAMGSAQEFPLSPGLTIRVVTGPYFLATKLEAFKGRGHNDYAFSHDLEDIIAVVDGRPALAGEIRMAPQDLQRYIAESVAALLKSQRFFDSLPGLLLPDESSQSRLGKLIETLRRLGESSVRRRQS